MSEMLQLHVSISGSKPLIWRRLVLDPRLTMGQLHTAIQVAFEWQNCHLHLFEAKDKTKYGHPSHWKGEVELDDERKTLIGGVFHRPSVILAYEYDMGDSWVHRIKLEKRVDSETIEYPHSTFIEKGRGVFAGKKRAAMCIAGERAGPPEDCGGVYGLQRLLELRERPRRSLDEDEREQLEWLGEEYDPARVCLSTINQELGRIRVRKVYESSGG